MKINRILKGIDSVLEKIQRAILILSTALIILMMCTGVVMRYFLKMNFDGLEELLLILGFWIYFIGGSLAFRDNDHMEASVLAPFLKTEKAKGIYMVVRSAISFPIIVILAIWAYEYLAWSIKMNPTTVTYNIPYCVAQMPILICFVLAVFYTAAILVQSILNLKKLNEGKHNNAEGEGEAK